MAKTRIQIAKPDIVRFFDGLPTKILKRSEIARYLAENASFWRLTQKTTVGTFIDYLIKSAHLQAVEFPFPPPYRKEVRYTWRSVPFYEVVLALKPGSYFSHYTAVKMHGLTEQIPKTVYVNQEQANESLPTGRLSQATIDAAFRRPVRVSGNVAETERFRVCVTSGKNTGALGVIEEERPEPESQVPARMRLTNVERTLIDIAVRPVYAGGVHEVLKAYRLARNQASVNRLTAMLQKLNYIYPYHQVIGFYLQRAGFSDSAVDLLRRFPQEYDFYLTHQIESSAYVPEWHLHVPSGL